MKFIKLPLLALILCLLMAVSVSARSWNVVSIEKADKVLLDDQISLAVDLNRGEFDIGSFKLSIFFDPNALTLSNAVLGTIFVECNWEHFEYQVIPCPGCEYDIAVIEAVADYYDDGNTPTCLCGPGQIATLIFQTTSDSAYTCTSSPVGFYWLECDNNQFVNVARDTLWFSDYVFDYYGNDVTGTPNFGGADKLCLEQASEVPFRFLDFAAGGVNFKCPLSFLCGDINGDDKINLSDPVYLVAYLFKGGPAPDPLERGNVNCEGEEPNLDDLVYIINYIFYLGQDPCCE